MPNGFATAAGGGGGQVILRAEGQQGNKVTATLGSREVKGTIPEGGALQLKLPGLGLWHVKTETGNGDYSFEQDVKVYRYGITPCWAIAKKPFSDCTPAEIQFVAKAGLCEEFGWEIGDSHPVAMIGGEEITLQICDFNHDVGTDGKTVLPLTLGMKNGLSTGYAINALQDKTIGWANCQFRTETIPLLKGKFPEEWQKIMTKCQKKTSIGNGSTTIRETEEDLFLFSEAEVSGFAKYSNTGEGKVYPIFTDAESRIKLHGSEGSPGIWWTRSPPSAVNNTYPTWVDFGRDGAAGNSYMDYLFTTVLGFCVG